MIFNSRTISLVVGLFVSFCSLLYARTIAVEAVELLLLFLVTFLSAFTIVFSVLELLVFKEIRYIQSVVKDFRTVTKVSEVKDVETKEPMRKIGHHLYTFANRKEKEIEKLKQLENFRREFLADISHELKTPIFSAQGFIHTLLDGAMDDEEVRDKFLTKAAKNLDSLNTIIQDLVNISQLETGEFKLQLEYFDLGILVSEVMEQSEHLCEKYNVQLNTDFDSEAEYEVVGDRYRISQVLTNLITNAIKYGRVDDKGTVTVKITNKKKAVTLSIADQGPGISEEHTKRIFQRFYRVDKSRSKELGGTGLGLAIVKHVLEAHNSQIQVESNLGKGTTFFFNLKKNF